MPRPKRQTDAAVDPWGFDDAPIAPAPKPRIGGHTFRAELDVTELDDRARPGPAWAARAQTLSRSHLVLLSRRMSYPGRVMLIAVHLIDAQPTPLQGRVVDCDYHADGLYQVSIELMPLDHNSLTASWFASRAK